MVNTLGRLGAWQRTALATPELAAGLEALGYGTLWLGGSPGGDLAEVEELLDATESLVVATGIVNIWKDDAGTIAAAWHRIAARHPGRFLLGIGVGHPEATSAYTQPYRALETYLDRLDEAEVPAADRVLAALGPKVLRLSALRSAGAHPYLTTPEHTRQARELLGDGVLLAPEQKAVIDPDPVRARAIGRPVIAKPYLSLANYTGNLRRLGYTDAELADGGNDRLIDALLAHGDASAVASRIVEHLDAGADHVAVQLLTAPGADLLDGYRQVAAELLSAAE
jgi:probable F420-dependent oxidoreductase